jgi:hypothetical protein
MNRFSAILGLLAIAALSALIGARAQVIDWVPFEPAPSEFPREAFRTIVPQSCGGTAPRANPPGIYIVFDDRPLLGQATLGASCKLAHVYALHVVFMIA